MEIEDGTFFDAARPAGGDGLETRVEPHTLHSMNVMIAEKRALPATKRVVGNGNRDRDIDAHHADLGATDEIMSRIAVTGEDGGAVPIFVVVDHPDRRFIVVRPNNGEDRPENLVLVD